MLANIYLQQRSLFDPHQKKGPPIWNSIIKAFKCLEDGFRFKIGDGQTRLWFTPWLCKEPLCNLVLYVDVHDLDLRICDVWLNESWHLNKIHLHLPPEVINHFHASVPRLVAGLEDTWVWGECTSGTYSVRSAYSMLLEEELAPHDGHGSWT